MIRPIPSILAAFAFNAPAAAPSWEDCGYPEYAISIAFPANLNIEITSDEVADGRSVPPASTRFATTKASSNDGR
jgi:hypothetical protein